MMALALRGISKRFGATVALDGVDLEIAAGEVLAVIGENGAGKSTLLNIVAGSLKPDSGAITMEGAGVAYIRQELSLFPHLTVAENILMGGEPARFGVIDGRAMQSRTRDLLAGFGRPEIDPLAMVGALIMAFLRNGCQQVGWPNYIQEIIIGAIIVIAVALESRTRARG